MKKKPIFVSIIVLFIVVIIVLAMQTNTNIVKYKLKANVTELRVNDSKLLLGISNDQTEFNFGVVPENITVKKILNLKNNENFDSLIKIYINGDISDYIYVGEENFVLKSKEGKQIEIIFNATKIGYYTGEIEVYITTPKYGFLAPLSLWKL